MISCLWLEIEHPEENDLLNLIEGIEDNKDPNLEQFYPYLRHPSLEVRKKLANVFLNAKGEITKEALVVLSRDVSPDILKIINPGLIKYVEAIQLKEYYTKLLKHSDSEIVVMALCSLLKVHLNPLTCITNALPTVIGLIETLKQDSKPLRCIAMRALLSMKSGNVERALKEDEPFVIQSLVDVITLGEYHLQNKVKPFILYLGEATIPYLKDILLEFTPDVSWFAAELMGEIGSSSALPWLIQALETKDWIILDASSKAIEYINDIKCLPILESLLKSSKNINLTFCLIRTLGQFKYHNIVAILFEATSSHNFGIKKVAVQALGKMGIPEAKEALLECLGDPNYYFRSEVIQALEAYQEQQIINRFLHLISDNSIFVQIEAIQSLGNMQVKEAIPELLKLTHHENNLIKQYAVEAINKIQGG